MREIKFRAWDKRANEWITDYDTGWYSPVYFHNGTVEVFQLILVDELINGEHEQYDKQITHLHEAVEIMQYTGLKDKNGVEIYEGDIVTSEEYPFTSDGLKNYAGEIYWWDEESAYYYDVKPISDRVAGRACGGMLGERASELEVIGNIYENGDLLT